MSQLRAIRIKDGTDQQLQDLARETGFTYSALCNYFLADGVKNGIKIDRMRGRYAVKGKPA